MIDRTRTVYLVGGVRTPIGRYGGALAAMRPDDLAAHVVRRALERTGVTDLERIDDVILGCVCQAGEDNRNVARMAALLAGLPTSVAGATVNRLCGSGLDAIAGAARAVAVGDADLIVAGGVESMSRAPFVLPKAEQAYSRSAQIYDTTMGWRFINPKLEAEYGIDAMPQTAQNVADEHHISRADQDAMAVRSQQRAAVALASGRLAREIVPVEVPGRRGSVTVVDRDEHPRDTTADGLAGLRPLFPGGSITAGNASGVNDGAAAVVVASERAVAEHHLTPLARVVSTAVAGVEPRVMGLGPIPATRKLLERTGTAIGDIGVVELNEAFAAQGLAVLRALGIPDDAEHVNPHGGAIALGHPLGMTGARIALSAAVTMTDEDRDLALVSMCIGVGQGISMLLARA